jgi:predicted O-methyltransferase YrrM
MQLEVRVVPKLIGRFDMVFIDADKSEYLDYLRLVEDKLPMGSVVVAHSAGIFTDEMGDYLDYVRSSGIYRSKYITVGNDGLEVNVKP